MPKKKYVVDLTLLCGRNCQALLSVFRCYLLMMLRLFTTRTGSVHAWVSLWPHALCVHIRTCRVLVAS